MAEFTPNVSVIPISSIAASVNLDADADEKCGQGLKKTFDTNCAKYVYFVKVTTHS